MNPDPTPPEPNARRAVMARDAGLRRISTTTRWIATGVVALSGALALIASNAFHGRAATATTANQKSSTPLSQQSTSSSSTSSSSTSSSATSSSSTSVQAPQSVVQQQPVAVSGGS